MKWIAWGKYGSRGSQSWIIRQQGESHIGYTEQREPTEEEIAAEVQRRAERAAQAAADKAFRSDPRYVLAGRVRGILEWQSPADNTLDCLTLAEWQSLLEKLEKKVTA